MSLSEQTNWYETQNTQSITSKMISSETVDHRLLSVCGVMGVVSISWRQISFGRNLLSPESGECVYKLFDDSDQVHEFVDTKR